MTDRLLKVEEVAVLLGQHPATVYRKIARGELATVRDESGGLRVAAAEVGRVLGRDAPVSAPTEPDAAWTRQRPQQLVVYKAKCGELARLTGLLPSEIRAAALGWASSQFGRPVGTSKELTGPEMDDLIDEIAERIGIAKRADTNGDD